MTDHDTSKYVDIHAVRRAETEMLLHNRRTEVGHIMGLVQKESADDSGGDVN